jgi:hypothetical protein
MQGSESVAGVTHEQASALIRISARPLEVTFGRSSKLASSAAVTQQSMVVTDAPIPRSAGAMSCANEPAPALLPVRGDAAVVGIGAFEEYAVTYLGKAGIGVVDTVRPRR